MPGHQVVLWHQPSGRQCHDRIQREDDGRGAGDGTIGPLPLRFHAQMRTGLFEGDLDRPAADELGQDLFRFGSLVSAEEGLRCKLALRIAHQYPAQWHRRQTFVIPDGGAGGDFDGLVSLAVPLGQCDGMPAGVFGGRYGVQRWLSCPFAARSSNCASWTLWRWIIQSGIESQAGDDGDLAARRIEQFERRETAVGDDHNGAPGDPAPDHQQHLTGAVGKFIRASSTLLVQTPRSAASAAGSAPFVLPA